MRKGDIDAGTEKSKLKFTLRLRLKLLTDVPVSSRGHELMLFL